MERQRWRRAWRSGPAAGLRTWTVIDGRHQTVVPVEDWLEAHRYLWSPNTVRGYATALTQWWSFLEQRGETEQWTEVGVPAMGAFLSWLRNGRTLEHALVATAEGPSPETLEARLAAVISFYRWHEAVFGVPVAGRLMRGAPRRAPCPGGWPETSSGWASRCRGVDLVGSLALGQTLQPQPPDLPVPSGTADGVLGLDASDTVSGTMCAFGVPDVPKAKHQSPPPHPAFLDT